MAGEEGDAVGVGQHGVGSLLLVEEAETLC